MPAKSQQAPPPSICAAHVTAWILACTTFPLIWMGGLVTTYGAGMAVPDWPSTYGYNLFLYPLGSWLKVWDVFLEHGHRLLGSLVGLVTIVLVLLLWRRDRRRVLWWMAGVALVGVCLQGVLGGLRVVGAKVAEATILGVPAPAFLCGAAAALVLLVQAIPAGPTGRRQVRFWIRAVAIAAVAGVLAWFGIAAVADRLFLAKVHGCTAPIFFVLAVAIVIMTSRRWAEGAPPIEESGGRLMRWLTVLATGAIYGQIVLGANLRHLAPDAAPWWFTLWVSLHVIVASAIVLLIVWLVIGIRRCPGVPLLPRRISLLAGLFLIQLVLGVTTWVTNYGWPLWFTQNVLALEYTVVAEGLWQALSTTAHVAVGSLCLAAATSTALWSHRLLALPAKPVVPKPEAKSGAKRGAPRRKTKR